MRRRNWTWALMVTVGLAGAVGCEVEERRPPRRHVVVYDAPPPPPPPVVVQPPPPAVVVEPPPPPPLVEVQPVSPGPEFVWVGGRYFREHGGYVWHRGYYDRRYR